jgi:hypothetical protein
MTIDELRQKIAAEQAEREQLIEHINQEIVFRNGRIAMLQELLAAREAAEAQQPPAP